MRYMSDILLFILGIIMIVSVGIRLFRPFWGFSKSLVSRLNSRKTTKVFLISHNINGCILGLVLIIAGFLPDYLKICVCMPLLGIVFVIILVCNKIFVGTYWAYVPNK